ncbi:glycosyltransferase [Arthrobacter sp. OVS8]|nr:glycosyltransferase [Arthrobacter sp. OVS8]
MDGVAGRLRHCGPGLCRAAPGHGDPAGSAGPHPDPGELRGGELEAEWAAADLSLLISRAETFGLVVTESIARGVPVVVRAGTGAVEALAAGTPGPTPRRRTIQPPCREPPSSSARTRLPRGGAAALAVRSRRPHPLAGRGDGRPGPAARLGHHSPDRAGRREAGPPGRPAGSRSGGKSGGGTFPCAPHGWTMT